jgi:hypothetical protein
VREGRRHGNGRRDRLSVGAVTSTGARFAAACRVMQCRTLIFSGHAVTRMFERSITREQVRSVIQTGDIIASYPDDIPYPSSLVLGFLHSIPLHVVVGVDANNQRCYVITVYVPDPARWSEDFKTRKPQ